MNKYVVIGSSEFDKLRKTKDVALRQVNKLALSIYFRSTVMLMPQLSQPYDNKDNDNYAIDDTTNVNSNKISLQNTLDLETETFYAYANDSVRVDMYKSFIEFKFKHCSGATDGSMLGSEYSTMKEK